MRPRLHGSMSGPWDQHPASAWYNSRELHLGGNHEIFEYKDILFDTLCLHQSRFIQCLSAYE